MARRKNNHSERQAVDITELAVVGEQFPLRLMQLGFRLMQSMDEAGRDLFRLVLPPVCEVPAGPFLMGSNTLNDSQAQDDEVPQHQVILGAFQIGRYPVTVTEYTCAMEMGAATEPRQQLNFTWQYQRHNYDHPVVCLTWIQARDYAAWLAQVTGLPWRLPTEAEWEKAARGTDGRIYPWGDQWGDAQVYLAPVPVGRFPQGASPYAMQDVVGNASGWCPSLYRPYPYHAGDGREKTRAKEQGRAFRGHSWIDEVAQIRVAQRGFHRQYIICRTNGVRLVLGGEANMG